MSQQVGPAISSHGLDKHGIARWRLARWNLRAAALYEHAIEHREGMLTRDGAMVVTTGEHTGRSPRDKFVVEDPSTRDKIAWGEVNRPMSEEAFDNLLKRVRAHYQAQELYVQDLYAGADPDYRLKVRVVTEHAWHAMFARNMFIVPPTGALADFEPDFTILHAPDFRADPEIDKAGSSTVIALHFGRRMVVIGGTSYAGEIKKSIFTVLNYLLPQKGVVSMHCSANKGAEDDVALFFGLSGTGKTTLSSDPTRTLIGDDEHGWSDNGIFNFEGGCYAKVIRLDKEAEPEIHDASLRFGSILENVVVDPETRLCDFDDDSLTENTRSSYPLRFIPNASPAGTGGHPKNVVMLTCDAFGVLPPISRLTPEQAMYHFLSGYTARVAGTEKGVTTPEATFSACFGAPFMPCHPTVYAELLGERIREHDASCWLVNTGWTAGPAGTGYRMKIAHTRALLRAALAGKLDRCPGEADPVFGLWVPSQCDGVPADVLMPRNTWSDPAAYDRAAADVARRFEENFRKFEGTVDPSIVSAGIRAAA